MSKQGRVQTAGTVIPITHIDMVIDWIYFEPDLEPDLFKLHALCIDKDNGWWY